jgi:flagellar motor switch protein FliG
MTQLATIPLAPRSPASRPDGIAGDLRANLTGREKAAIIVRLILAHGGTLPLQNLPDHLQAALTDQVGRMPVVTRDMLHAVAEELAGRLASIGLSFPAGLDGALELMDGHISPAIAEHLRKRQGGHTAGDPWQRLAALDTDALLPLIAPESIQVAAVALSKLPVSKAADLLGRIPGDRARRIAYAVSKTGAIRPETVARIGQSLASQLEAVPVTAFDTGPVERVGAILNFSPASTRDDVLSGLQETDADFADQVRKAIFTFTLIPARIDARDVPKIIRVVDQPVLIAALAGAKGEDVKSAEFILANMSQRMAANLREEMAALAKLSSKDAEIAQGSIVAAIRELEAAGELFLVAADEDAEAEE